MTDIASFQRALDLYGAAVYWSYRSSESSNDRAGFAAAQDLATVLRERAVGAGVSSEQLDDAEQYARNCVSNGRKPLMAGRSFSHFRTEQAVR
ncbi:hypothetical protein AB4Z39_04900 [Mycobacterium adipatum]|uniref:hypothetical protein n=1 Tax=Mycobacterium adipatum TaxID=1682113 RepID=UPI0034E0BD4D